MGPIGAIPGRIFTNMDSSDKDTGCETATFQNGGNAMLEHAEYAGKPRSIAIIAARETLPELMATLGAVLFALHGSCV
jgi:hypothetical protein